MDSLVKIDSGFLQLLESSFGSNNLPMPFVKEIFLIETNIAGTSFLDLEEIEPNLLIGSKLIFIREPDNLHDSKAIRICNIEGAKLGYIPKANNEILANLMDAGKLIFGLIEEKEWRGKWLKVIIKVFLRD